MSTSKAPLLVLLMSIALSAASKLCAADPNGIVLQQFEIHEEFGVSHPYRSSTLTSLGQLILPPCT
jgi:hypothetical protein